MAFVIADRVRESTTTTGTGAVTLAGAYVSFQSFSAAIGNGNNTYYTIASAVSGEWEVGIGTYTSAGNTLSRDTVLASSNAGALVNFSSAVKDVFVTQPASRAIFVQNGGTGLQTSNSAFTANRVLYANAATTTATSANLTFDGTTLTAAGFSGPLNGTVGATTPNTGAFTTLSASSTVSGTGFTNYFASPPPIGSTAANTGAFTTLTTSSTVTLNGGTANGVLYLNGSKVATSGSAVTYDGTTFALGAAWTTNPLAGASAPLFYQYGSGGSAIRVIGDGGAGTLSAFRFDNGASPAICLLGKARGTYASSSAVQTGDYLGEIRMNGYGGTTSRNLVNILGGVETYTSDTDIATFFEFRTSSSGSASATEKMRLTAAGNLGIGTTSPANRLDVFASADWQGRVVGNAGFNGGLIVEGNATGTRAQINLKTNNGTAREYYLRNVSGTFSLLDNTAGTIPFTVEAATPSNTIYANASGNIGIGTTSPGSKLTVSGDIQILSTNYLSFSNTAQQTYIRAAASNTLAFGTNSTEVARFDSSGNLGLGVTPSAWGSGWRAVNIGLSGALAFTGSGANDLSLSTNSHNDGTNWIYKYTGDGAARYSLTSLTSQHRWFVAPTGIAGNTISFTQAMTLDASGKLLLGATSNTGRGGANTTALFYKASGTQYVDIQTGSSGDSGLIFSGSSTSAYGLINYSTASNAMLFYANSAEVFRIDSSGNFGITVGNNPTQALNIYRTGSTQTVMAAGNSNTGLNGTYFGVDTTGNGIVNTTGAFATIFSNNGSERARITSGGLVGINTSSPSNAQLVVKAASAYTANTYFAARLQAGAYADTGGYTTMLGFGVEAAAWSKGAIGWTRTTAGYDTGYMAFYVNNSANSDMVALADERARITAGGELLVGSTNNSATVGSGIKSLIGYNGANNPQFAIVTSASTNTTSSLAIYSTGAAAYRFYVADNGQVYATNTTITGISDQRLKENIRDLDSGLDAIMALKPRKFDWKEGKGKDIKNDRGFIAQEFEQVFPDLIDEWKDPVPEGEEPYKAVRADLIPVLVKAMQEQQAMIETLKAEVAALKGA